MTWRPNKLRTTALLVIVGALLTVHAASGQTSAGQALVWQVGGAPGRAEGLGTLFWHEPGQGPVNLSDVPDEGAGTRVFACGMEAFSPDGEAFIAYIGGRTGGLYRVPLDDEGELVRWGDAHALACNGRGHARFSPDGSRWAYINFEGDAASSLFPDGELRVLEATDGSEVAAFENAVAFDLTDTGAYFVQFFTDIHALADEAVVNWWDGESLHELAALTLDENCDSWTSARVVARADGEEISLSLGERCTGGSVWHVYTLTPDGEATQRILVPSGGLYAATAYTNQVVYLPDDEQLLAAYPNGGRSNLANLVLITPETNSITLIGDQVVVDAFPDGRAQHVLFSPDGSAVAFRTDDVVTGEQALHVLPLDGGTNVAVIPAGPPGDVIAAFFFTPDSEQVVFIGGGPDRGDNSIFVLTVGEDEPRRVTRGRFMAGGGMAGDGVAYVLEFVPADEDYQRDATNLVAVSLDDGARTIIVNGRESAAWAYPLAWR